jgi:hypothetical protein
MRGDVERSEGYDKVAGTVCDKGLETMWRVLIHEKGLGKAAGTVRDKGLRQSGGNRTQQGTRQSGGNRTRQ